MHLPKKSAAKARACARTVEVKRYGIRIGTSLYHPKLGTHMLVALVRKNSVKLYDPVQSRVVTVTRRQYLRYSRRLICIDEAWLFLSPPSAEDAAISRQKQLELDAKIAEGVAYFFTKKGWRLPGRLETGAISAVHVPRSAAPPSPLVDFLQEAYRSCRKYQAATIVVSQQLSDLVPENREPPRPS